MEQVTKIKNLEKGISLVEIIVVIFVVSLFSMILISDFPKIQRQFALSRVAYSLAQNIRRVEDLGLSGVRLENSFKVEIPARGYGVFVDSGTPGAANQYLIYADDGNQVYSSGAQSCDNTNPVPDCFIEAIDITKEDAGLYIKDIEADGISILGRSVSINFAPPGPIVNITDGINNYSDIKIILGIKSYDSTTRIVEANTSGMINVK